MKLAACILLLLCVGCGHVYRCIDATLRATDVVNPPSAYEGWTGEETEEK